MKKHEKFKVFDACQPTVSEVKEYLERISGEAPFNLIFVKDGKKNITNKLKKDLGELEGVIIDRTIFYTKCLDRAYRDTLPEDTKLSAEDVFRAGRVLLQPKDVTPMSDNDLELLKDNLDDYVKLLDMLSVWGYEAMPLQNVYMTINKTTEKTFLEVCDIYGCYEGESDIFHHLYFRKIFFCCHM